MFKCMFTFLLFTLARASHHSHYFFLPVVYFSFFPQNEITSGKVLFPEHLPLSRIQAGIKSGSFLQGTFRASRDNYLEASVFVHGEGEDSMEVCAFVCEHVTLQGLNRNAGELAVKNSKMLRFLKSAVTGPLVSCQVLIQGLQNLNRAVNQDVVAVQVLPQNQWVAPSSVVLQDEGEAKDDNTEEEEEERVVNLGFVF